MAKAEITLELVKAEGRFGGCKDCIFNNKYSAECDIVDQPDKTCRREDGDYYWRVKK